MQERPTTATIVSYLRKIWKKKIIEKTKMKKPKKKIVKAWAFVVEGKIIEIFLNRKDIDWTVFRKKEIKRIEIHFPSDA